MNGKEVVEALIQRYCLHGIPSMFTFAKYENDTLSFYETTNVFIDAYLLFQNLFSSVRVVYIDQNNVGIFKCFVRFISIVEWLSKGLSQYMSYLAFNYSE